MDITAVVAAAIGSFFAVVVKPVVDGMGRLVARLLDDRRSKAARRRQRLHDLEEVLVDLTKTLPTVFDAAWARLPILAESIGDPELIEAVGRLLSAPGGGPFDDERGNVARVTGRLLKDA